MPTVTSKDGTIIAYNRSGTGPTLVLVGGALEYRAWVSESSTLGGSPLLAQHFTVIQYDRRGRGESGDTPPYAVDREIEDIEALIDAEGGSAYLFGISSGAALALHAAVKLGSKIKKLAIYEAPYNDDETARKAWREYRANLDQIVAEGRKGDAVGLFMMLVGMPPDHLEGMRQHPLWGNWEAVGHTLAYDAAALGAEAAVATDLAAKLKVPALVLDGSASYPFMHTAAVALAEAMPQGQQRTLEGQTHEVSTDVLAPILVEYFEAR
ncbi:MAG: alpha/beta hydrolase family protein [Anaerolineae bacterium]